MNYSSLVKIRNLIQRERKPPFFKELDLYAIEDGILIGVTGTLGYGYRLDGRDLLLDSEEEINDFEKRMRKFLNAVPEGLTLHFIVRAGKGDDAILSEYKDSIKAENPFADRFAQSKVQAYRMSPFVKRELFLFVVIHPKGKRLRSSLLPDLSIAFGKKPYGLSATEYQIAKTALMSFALDIADGFRNLGFLIRPLQEEEVLEYFYTILNPFYGVNIYPFDANHFRNKESQDPSSLRSRLLLSSPNMDLEYFRLGNFYHRTLNLLQLPEATNLRAMRSFEDALGKSYFLSVTIEVPDQEREKAEIKKQGNFAKSGNFYSRTKDYDAIARAGESEELLSTIASTSDKLFYISLAVMIRDSKKEECLRLSQEALRAFRRLGDARGMEDHMNHDRLFLSFLPLQGNENPLSFLIRSEALTHLLPLQASWRGTERVGLLMKTHRDEPLRLDLFDSSLQAKHAVMLGSTGSGKSFFTNHLLLHFLMESCEHEVIVIDLGGSYRKLANILEGSYLEVECSEKYSLNPFPAKTVLFRGEQDADSTFLQFLKELLQKMISPARIWSSSEKMLLERAIHEVYRPINGIESPLLGDIERCLRDFKIGDDEDKRKAYQFSKELALFTQGEYGKILNRKGNFDFDSRFTVFDLRKISQYPELQEILLLVIPFALKRKFENLNLKKVLVLDECWHLLKDTQGTNLIELFYRTARKFNGAVLSISQNPEDFLDARIAGVMVNNSPVKYILRLKKGHEKLSLFGLNENEIAACKDLEVKPGRYSEIFIQFDDRGVVAKLEPNPLEYWVATTDAEDVAEETRQKNSDRELSSLEVIENLAHRFPHGVNQLAEAV